MENVIAYLQNTIANNEFTHPNQSSNLNSPALSLPAMPITADGNAMSPSNPTNDHPIIRHILPSPSREGKVASKIMQNKRALQNPSLPIVKVHVDGGANRSITNIKENLVNFCNIRKYPMSGVAAGEAALICTGIGFLPWQADTGEVLLVKCHYSSDAADTIVSPTDIVVTNISDLEAWGQYSNVDSGIGHVEFYCRENPKSIKFSLISRNGLWYHHNRYDTDDFHNWILEEKPTICRINKAAEYGLGHFRYGCPGQRTLSLVHMHVDNQPKLSMPCFFKCNTCMLATGDYRDTKSTDEPPPSASFDDWFDDMGSDIVPQCDPGQHFHVDFGFMKGTGYCKKDDEGQTITSIDGYRSYLLVIDRKTRYVWVFLTKNKKPSLSIFAEFLKQHGHPTAQPKTIRSDKGGELWGSEAFRSVVMNAGYVMDPTAPDAQFQNGKAEGPNRNLAKTVRCLLYNAGLGPEYWSFALQHAVYLKNRLPHCATNTPPLTAYTGKRPNAKRLRIFGCPVVVRNLGKWSAKLDLNTSAGIFLGYTTTDKNIIYRDTVTGRFTTATHVVFDEAGYPLPATERTPVAKLVQEYGYGKPLDEPDDTDTIACNDDYTGNVQVLLENNSDVAYHIKIGDRIAQMVIMSIQTPPVEQTQELCSTTRDGNGFGSTGLSPDISPQIMPSTSHDPDTAETAIRNMSGSPPITNTSDILPTIMPINVTPPQNDAIEKPYDLFFSLDLFDQTIEVAVPIKGDHPTLGILTTYCDARQRLQITDMAIRTPDSRLKNWRTVLRKSYLLKFNDFLYSSRTTSNMMLDKQNSEK